MNSNYPFLEYTGGIEFRGSETGPFQFIYISDMKCMFSTAFTDMNILNLSISRSNFFNVILERSSIITDPMVFSGIIHFRFNDQNNTITTENCCFCNNDFTSVPNDNARIFSKTTYAGSLSTNGIKMISCSYDCDNDMITIFDGVSNKNKVIENFFVNVETYNDIKMLKLGECEGVIIPSPLFTKTNYFLHSNEFSESSEFSKTSHFLNSEDFTKSLSFIETKYAIPEFDNSISYKYSFVLSYKYMKSVSFKLDCYMSNTYWIFIDDNGETKVVLFESYFSKYNSYIIHYLTQTFVGTMVPFETSLKKTKLSQQNLIGIVCGSVTVFSLY